MSGRLTIVTYHYVRDYGATPFPGIKGLDVRDFAAQIDYFARHHTFVTVDQCRDALDGMPGLPDRALLLTFDDGYADHYEHVFPLLRRRGIQGLFFVPARPITENIVLDVNKIHYILASAPDPSALLPHLLTLMERNRERLGLEDPRSYVAAVTDAGRYDTREVHVFKRLLQRILPAHARGEFSRALFAELVTPDERAFSKTLYLNMNQMREMASHGMAFGNHGHSHECLSLMSQKELGEDLARGLELMTGIGARTDAWAISYPYGAHGELCIQVAQTLGCIMGVTIQPDIARLEAAYRMLLPRLNTNDFPRDAAAPPNAWTLRAASSGMN